MNEARVFFLAAQEKRGERNNFYLYVMYRNLMRWLPGAVLLLTAMCTAAQEGDEPRTIRIKKESNLVKAKFDNNEMRLFVIDRFGNVRANKVVSYTLWIKGKKKGATPFRGTSNELSPEMIRFLEKQKEASKIFFTGIIALDEGEQQVPLPDVIDVWFPPSPQRR